MIRAGPWAQAEPAARTRSSLIQSLGQSCVDEMTNPLLNQALTNLFCYSEDPWQLQIANQTSACGSSAATRLDNCFHNNDGFPGKAIYLRGSHRAYQTCRREVNSRAAQRWAAQHRDHLHGFGSGSTNLSRWGFPRTCWISSFSPTPLPCSVPS